MLYDNVEPFGSPRDDERAGIVASVIANVNRDPKKRREPFMPGDFFARETVAPEPMSVSKLLTALRAAAPRQVQEPRE